MRILGLKVADYWHIEIFVAVPLIAWFVWRVETIVSLLNHCSLYGT